MGYVSRFPALLLGFEYLRLFAVAVFRPKRLVLAVAVEMNNRIGELQNTFRRAVIAFQLKGFGPGKRLFEMKNIFDLRAAPAVNGLIVVAHDEEIAVHGGEELDDLKLHRVGVLKLVHENIAEPSAEVSSGFLVPLQKLTRFVEKVVEI